MRRFIPIALTTLTIATLTSCSAPPAPKVAEPTPSTAAAPTAATKSIFDAKTIAGFATLQGVVTKTQTATAAGDFATASKEFAAFETTWKTIEDAIAPKSTATYTAVEKSLKAAEAAIEQKDKAAALSALTALNATLAASAKL
jgi:hypothetical protein